MTIDTTVRDDIERELRALKEGALRATWESDVAYYDGYMSDDAVGIFPYGTFDKAAVLAQISQPQPSFGLSLSRASGCLCRARSVCGVVYYTAVYTDRRAAVSTLFLRRNGEWRAVLYQQTVLET